MMVEIPGAAGLVPVAGVVHLNEPVAVFEGMVEGWCLQQRSRMLGETTIMARERLVRRFQEFTGSHPWQWSPGDVEEFTVSLTSGSNRLAVSTIRGYHMALRMFGEYITDPRYEWVRQCRDRFGQIPVQVCHEWNTVAHLNEYEGKPQRRPLTYAELQHFFDFHDDRADRGRTLGTQGRSGGVAGCAAVQDDLRVRAAPKRSVSPRRRGPALEPARGQLGNLRFGACALRQVFPRRCPPTAHSVGGSGVDWAIEGLRQWVEEGRPLLRPGDHPALWVTERLTRVDVDYLDRRFASLRTEAGLDEALTLHCLRHSYVTHLIEHGYPERFVTEQVGHAFASTTAIYTSASNDFKNQALQHALARVCGKGST